MNRLSPFQRQSAFSLIELLTVMAIIGLMVGVAAPALKSITSAGGLTGGGYKADNLFAGARQNSISKGVLTAVVVLTAQDAAGEGDPVSCRTLVALELAPKADGSSPTTSDWKQVSKWEKLPQGIIIDNDATNSKFLTAPTAAITPALPSLVYKGKTYGTNDYAYQVFLPSGRLRSPPSPCNLALAEGFYTGTTPTFTTASKANYFNFVFNDATGETKISRP